jgi:hypothetical protein
MIWRTLRKFPRLYRSHILEVMRMQPVRRLAVALCLLLPCTPQTQEARRYI